MLRILCGVCLALALCLCAVTESQADDPVWKVTPSSAQAVTVVRDMESFSNKIDHVARLMEVEAPHVLEFAMVQSNIRDGLNVTGNLAWVVRPYMRPQGQPAIGTLYLLPTTNYNKVIQPLAPKDLLGGVQSVTIEGRPAFVAPMKESAVFAFAEDEHALRENLTLEATLEAEITPLAPWLEKQEVYFSSLKKG